MKSKAFKSILPVGLAIILLLTPASLSSVVSGSTVSDSAVGVEQTAEVKSKDEVIYAILAADGGVRSMYSVNHFAIAAAGLITDYGSYTAVTNLTDLKPLTQNGDAVTAQTATGNFYYQGDLTTTELPWIFDISYSLDDVKTAPHELAGKSGELKIHILTKQNPKISATFYDNYMLQISITLDTGKCNDIKAPGAAVASAGKNKVIAYTVMPGKDAEISLSATVRDLTMTGIDISAMPFSMDLELPDTDSMISDFSALADAISDLNNGVSELTDGLAELKTGAGKLSSGSSDIKIGLSQLSDNSGPLIEASAQIGGALTQIALAFRGSSGEMDWGELSQLPQGLLQLAAGLDSISGGLIGLRDIFISAHAALAGSIHGIPDAAINQEQVAALYTQTDPSQHGLLDQLIASYTASQTVKGTYDQVKGAFDAVGPTIDTLAASLDSISATLDDLSGKIGEALSGMDMEQLAQLSAGLSELDRNYAVFHSGLRDYMNGVEELCSGYADFHNGLSSLDSGVGELYDGMVELRDGTSALSDETAKIPGTIQSEIDQLLAQYTGSDFERISFTSPKNKHTNMVQFVLKCDGIEKPEETKRAEVESGNETFWDRLTALFTGEKNK